MTALKMKLLEKGMKQRELARKINRSEQWVSDVATGLRTPGADDRRVIAKALGCAQKALWPELGQGWGDSM
ncbi:MAG: helix-turn-helix transcriptional regulator [Desulfofustis sp.]|nr:helix-turn-helix transcriptional regulator [Desulfofustis sp.]